jgi:hypothetical protein
MKKIAILGLSYALPVFALAAGSGTVDTIIRQLMDWLTYVAPALITVMVIMFIWTVIQYSLTTDDEKKKKAKKGIVSALIGVFVIVSFWGIIALVQRSFGIDPEVNPNIINIQTPLNN